MIVTFFRQPERPTSLVGVVNISKNPDYADTQGDYLLVFKKPHEEDCKVLCITETEDGEDTTQLVLSKEAAKSLFQALKEELDKYA